MYVCMYVWMYVCIYVYIHVCIYMFIYTYIIHKCINSPSLLQWHQRHPWSHLQISSISGKDEAVRMVEGVFAFVHRLKEQGNSFKTRRLIWQLDYVKFNQDIRIIHEFYPVEMIPFYYNNKLYFCDYIYLFQDNCRTYFVIRI